MARLSAIDPAVLFAVAGVCALALAVRHLATERPPIDLYFHGTSFVVAPGHVAISAGLLCAVYASVYWFLPRLLGRNLSISMGQLHFWLSLSAVLATVIPFLWETHLMRSAGSLNSDSLTSLVQSRQFQTVVLTVPIAILIFLLAQAVFFFNLFWSLHKRSGP